MPQRGPTGRLKTSFHHRAHLVLVISFAASTSALSAASDHQGAPTDALLKTLQKKDPSSDASQNTAAPAAEINALKAQIEQSMEAFTESSMPDAEKLKFFDKCLADLNMLLEQTKEDGPLDSLCTKAITSTTTKLEQLEDQQGSESSTPSRSEPEFTLASVQKKRTFVATAHTELLSKKKRVLEEQFAFLRAKHADNPDAASKALDAAMFTMSDLNEFIDRLGERLTENSRDTGR
jgi:hypothetical protein